MDMFTPRSCSKLIAPAIAVLTLGTFGSALAYETRGTTRTSVSTTSVNRSATATSVNRSASTTTVNRSASASTTNVNVNAASVNRNVNVNTTTVDVNRNVTVNAGCCYNNVGVAGAVAAGVVAGAVVGTVIAASALPPACSAVVVNGVTYKNCGGAWYQPQYVGTQVTYVVVNPPR